jgi:hypothetical protein
MPADLVIAGANHVVADDFMVADVSEHPVFDAPAKVGLAFEHRRRHEMAVEGPVLDRDDRPCAGDRVVDGGPAAAAFFHDREVGDFLLAASQFADAFHVRSGQFAVHGRSFSLADQSPVIPR